MDTWGVGEVAAWLQGVGGGAAGYAGAFQQHEIDGAALLTLTDRDLRDDLGVRELGVRRSILKEIERAAGEGVYAARGSAGYMSPPPPLPPPRVAVGIPAAMATAVIPPTAAALPAPPPPSPGYAIANDHHYTHHQHPLSQPVPRPSSHFGGPEGAGALGVPVPHSAPSSICHTPSTRASTVGDASPPQHSIHSHNHNHSHTHYQPPQRSVHAHAPRVNHVYPSGAGGGVEAATPQRQVRRVRGDATASAAGGGGGGYDCIPLATPRAVPAGGASVSPPPRNHAHAPAHGHTHTNALVLSASPVGDSSIALTVRCDGCANTATLYPVLSRCHCRHCKCETDWRFVTG